PPKIATVPFRAECPPVAGEADPGADRVDARRERDAGGIRPVAVYEAAVKVRDLGGGRSYRETENARVVVVKKSVDRHHDRRTGRTVARTGPAVVRRRQIEEPGGKLEQLVVRARRNRGTARIRGAPVSPKVPAVRRSVGILHERLRRHE